MLTQSIINRILSIIIVCVTMCLPNLSYGEDAVYGKNHSSYKYDPVSQPAGSLAADGYICLSSKDAFIRNSTGGALELCIEHKPIPWWSGKATSYCRKWGGIEEYLQKVNPGNPKTKYVGMGVNTWQGIIVLFYKINP